MSRGLIAPHSVTSKNEAANANGRMYRRQTCDLQALDDTPREEAEWILWMDLDTIAVESDIAFPLESYAGKDLVLWIMPDEVLHGNPMRKPPRLDLLHV